MCNGRENALHGKGMGASSDQVVEVGGAGRLDPVGAASVDDDKNDFVHDL